jgi:2-polyprenyl-3-methyl-5-hydroxy-6-metoxy-1,4-benzoquinol methylase
MGRGRNAIFLASLGWDVTGYDIAADALTAAQAHASRAGVTIRTQEASHDTFDFGALQWDLIVCAYCYMRIQDTQWPAIFLAALKPGGVFVFQTSTARMPVAEIAARWKDFHVLRVEDLDAGMVDDDWGPSRTSPTVKLVVRRNPAP